MGKAMRHLAWLLLFGMILAGCEEKAPVVPVHKEKKEAPGSVKIGFSMDTLEEERWVRDRDLFKQAVEDQGAEVLITEARGDDALQVLQAETLIAEGVDVLVIVPYNAEAAAAIVQKAHKAGIQVVSYDRLVRNADIDLYVSFDNERVGELQAGAITELVPKGKYVYIGGAETDYNAHLLKKGVFDVLKEPIDRGEIQVVYDEWTDNWLPENAYDNMKEALKASDGDIDAVIAANDATAGMAEKALEEAGLAGKIPVAGQDAELNAVRRIVQGTQAMTVYKPINILAEEAAALAISIARGEYIDTDKKINNGKIEVPSVLLQPTAVNKANLDTTIIADHFHTREEVYE